VLAVFSGEGEKRKRRKKSVKESANGSGGRWCDEKGRKGGGRGIITHHAK